MSFSARSVLASRTSSQNKSLVSERILRFMHKVGTPIFLGFIALEVGYGLSFTEDIMNELEIQGKVRSLSKKELKTSLLDDRGSIWVLIEKATISKS